MNDKSKIWIFKGQLSACVIDEFYGICIFFMARMNEVTVLKMILFCTISTSDNTLTRYILGYG